MYPVWGKKAIFLARGVGQNAMKTARCEETGPGW